MEEQEDGWLTVLEKNGLGPAAAILENYGINRSWVKSQVLRTVQALHQQGPKHRQKGQDHAFGQKRPRSRHSRKGRMARGRTLSPYLIGGSQTVQHCQDSRTCCVQFRRTHPIRAHLSDFLASSMRLTYDDDQKKSHAYYIELSMQSQFNKRGLR